VPATGFWVTLANPQLSVATNWPVMDGTTSSQSFTVTFAGQVVITGADTSRTVTVATQVLTLLLPSVTVKVTLFVAYVAAVEIIFVDLKSQVRWTVIRRTAVNVSRNNGCVARSVQVYRDVLTNSRWRFFVQHNYIEYTLAGSSSN
jgi:hypothetical protein